jgi:SAM-dependent methyltransferase
MSTSNVSVDERKAGSTGIEIPLPTTKFAPDSVAESYQLERVAHWDSVARAKPKGSRLGGEYHRRIEEIYGHVVSPRLRVIEFGCGQGDLLAAVEPARGVGVDFSPEMLRLARRKHPRLEFIDADVHDLRAVKGLFDVIIVSDLVNDLWDVQTVLQEARRLCEPESRLVLNLYSHLWEPVLNGAAQLGLATRKLEQNWLTLDDVKGLLSLSGFEVVRQWQEVLFSLPVPGFKTIADRYLVKLWPLRHLALANFVIARPAPTGRAKRPRVSIVVPARNEEGNIPEVFRRVSELGAGTELIFVEGHSRDKTYDAIKECIANHPDRQCKLFRQTGVGKGDAVRLGFAEASGDVLVILDADQTVRPEDLPRFVEVLESGVGEFINGVRLIYPMQNQAMRFFNLLANKFFSLAFSWLLGQPIKDTLCGTKVLWKKDYEKIARNRSYFGDFDPFGDFDLLFGAAKLGLKIVDMPIRYQNRTYGTTNIQRWRHGWLLLRMVIFAARRVKFV